jgi:molecular chaperone GrpE
MQEGTETRSNEAENAGEAPEVFTEEPKATVVEGTPVEPTPVEAEPESEKLKRLMADFDNFRKRSARERAQERQRGRRDAVEKLLPVYDAVTSGLLAMKGDENVRAGMTAVIQQLLTAFEGLGIAKVQTRGEKFDPARHEAIAQLPSTTVPEGIIIEESRSGFEDEIGLLRPAQVVVSAGPGPG